MKKIILIFAAVAAVFVLSEKNVFACICVPPSRESLEKRIGKALEESEAVFAGTVLDVIKKEEDGKVLVKIKVNRSWKGRLSKETTVLTGLGGADCGFPFKVGQSFLVYTYKTESGLETNTCLRTAKLANAEEDLKILGKGKAVGKDKT